MDVLEEYVKHCSTPVLMVTGENVGPIAAEAVRRGASDYVVKLGEYLFTIPLVVEKNLTLAKIKRENESLRRELERALAEVRDKNAQLQQSLRRLEEVAATDPLTGLYNRRHFSQLLEQLFAESQRYDNDLSCVMIDLDGYKQLNDAYGHQVGDQLLVLAGKVILANMPFILRVTRRTEIVWQANDGTRTAATLEDVKAIDPEIDVAVSYPWPLAYGEPPVAPATRILPAGMSVSRPVTTS